MADVLDDEPILVLAVPHPPRRRQPDGGAVIDPLDPPRLRILMFPARASADDNRFLDILTGALRARQVDVIDWRKQASLQRADIFHIHWPDTILDIGARPRQALRGRIIEANLFLTIARIKAAGGAVVWTVHNLQPHDPRLRTGRWARLVTRLIPEVDRFVVLSAEGIPEIRARFPAIDPARIMVARHPHYEGSFQPPARSRDAIRAAIGVPPDRPLLAMIGSLRANKGIAEALAAWSGLPVPRPWFILAGSASAEMAAMIGDAGGIGDGLVFERGRVSEGRITELHAAADLLLLPGADYFNSGTIFRALSQQLAVLAADTPTNRGTRAQVGEGLSLFGPPFDATSLAAALGSRARSVDGAGFDLGAYAPDRVAGEYLAAYRAALEKDRAHNRFPS